MRATVQKKNSKMNLAIFVAGGLAFFSMAGSSNPASAQAVTNRQALPQVSTSSADINCVDMPFLRSNGGSGAFGSGGAGGGAGDSGGGSSGSAGSGASDGSGAQPMPNLPPGWIGVTNSHTGAYMGAIPPGGNLYDFFNGKYGIVPGQEAEAAWIRDNQLQQAYDSGMFDGMGAWGPGGP